jgi:sec-independent protein translocase protein TatC
MTAHRSSHQGSFAKSGSGARADGGKTGTFVTTFAILLRAPLVKAGIACYDYPDDVTPTNPPALPTGARHPLTESTPMNFHTNGQQTDPDDFFSETRMSFGDHLEDLRLHLWRAIGGFLIALIASFAIGKPMLRFIAAPVELELQRYWDKYYDKKYRDVTRALDDGTMESGSALETEIWLDARALKKQLGIKSEHPEPVLDILPSPVLQAILKKLEIDDWLDAEKVQGGKWIRVQGKLGDSKRIANQVGKYTPEIGRRPALSTLNVQEAFMVYFKVSMVTGFILASPWIFFQIWSFIAAGLYPQEKRYVNIFLPVSIVLFLIGVLVCQFLVIPKAVEALLWFNEWLELEPDLRLNEWLGFAIFMPLVFGLSFQTPLVMLFFERVGILTIDTYRGKRRIAWFVMAVFAAIITPSTDAISMLYLWIPMSLLYELGILICRFAPQRPTYDIDVPESDELIEV